MIVLSYKITIPQQIRNIIKKNKLVVFVLTKSQFRFLVNKWEHDKDTVGLAILEDELIFINGERLTKEGFSQGQINFVILHEIAHILLNTGNEKKTDKYAEELAKKHKIEIEWD